MLRRWVFTLGDRTQSCRGYNGVDGAGQAVFSSPFLFGGGDGKRNSRYNKNKHTTSFKLHPSFATYCHPSFTKTTLTDNRLLKSIQKHYRSVSLDRKGILKSIEHTLDRTALHLNDLPSTL